MKLLLSSAGLFQALCSKWYFHIYTHTKPDHEVCFVEVNCFVELKSVRRVIQWPTRTVRKVCPIVWLHKDTRQQVCRKTA